MFVVFNLLFLCLCLAAGKRLKTTNISIFYWGGHISCIVIWLLIHLMKAIIVVMIRVKPAMVKTTWLVVCKALELASWIVCFINALNCSAVKSTSFVDLSVMRIVTIWKKFWFGQKHTGGWHKCSGDAATLVIITEIKNRKEITWMKTILMLNEFVLLVKNDWLPVSQWGALLLGGNCGGRCECGCRIFYYVI